LAPMLLIYTQEKKRGAEIVQDIGILI